MQLRFTREEHFRQERDFGAKIGATFEFLGAHWRPLGKCLLYFVLPVALVMGIGMGVMTNTMFNQLALIRGGTATDPSKIFGASYFAGIGVAMIAGLLAFAMLLSTVYGYVRVLVAGNATDGYPTPARVWQEVKPRLGRVLLAFLFFFGLYIAFVSLLVGLIATLGTLGWLVIFVFPLLFYIIVPLSLYFPAMWTEDLGVLQAMQRCFSLARGSWWSTFGLLFVSGMIQGMLTVVFVLPMYAVMFGKMLKIPGLDSDVLGVATQCFYAGGIILTYAISLVAVLFQYFNLVERKEGLGMRHMVASLGSTPTPAVHGSTYRPDDEGEY